MPTHDWTRVGANRFHDFRQSWMLAIRDALNAGLLPEGCFALAEHITAGPERDVVDRSVRGEAIRYVWKADRVVVRHLDGIVVAVVEIVRVESAASCPPCFLGVNSDTLDEGEFQGGCGGRFRLRRVG